MHDTGEDNGPGFSFEEAGIVKTFLSRHVVQETYDDAFRRKVIPHNAENLRERDAILASYDTKLAHVLSRVGSKPEPTE